MRYSAGTGQESENRDNGESGGVKMRRLEGRGRTTATLARQDTDWVQFRRRHEAAAIYRIQGWLKRRISVVDKLQYLALVCRATSVCTVDTATQLGHVLQLREDGRRLARVATV